MDEISTQELIKIVKLIELEDKAVQLLQNQKYDELIPLLNEMVGEGSGWAMHYLAVCHTYGFGIEIDMVKVNQLHLAAAELGLPEAQMAFGRNLLIGNGIEKDIEKGEQYLTMAADNGNGFAAYSLGEHRLARNYNRSEQDYFEAAQFFNKAAQLGDPRGMQRLAWLFTDGLGVEANVQEALRLNIAASDLGNEIAAFNAGVAFEYGRGTNIDLDRAFQYYERAAGKNIIKAMHNLGVFYFNGKGVQQDSSKAHQWYLAAANNGSRLSSYCLGLMYEEGETDAPPRSGAMAMAWFLIAQSQMNGNIDDGVSGKVAALTKELSSEETGRAIDIMETFSEAGFHWSQKALSDLYTNGLLVAPDIIKAEKWKAAANVSEAQAVELLVSQDGL